MAVNLICHMLFSVPASFFAQEASRRHMSDDQVGLHFALFATTIFLLAPFVARLMRHSGALSIYRRGICIISAATVCFSVAALADDWLFAPWTYTMRTLQGAGAALEEASAYVLIFHLAPVNRVSLFTGMVEVSTGLGYMLGAPLGGFLYAAGGFGMPFLVLGSALLLGVPILHYLPAIISDKSRVPASASPQGGGVEEQPEGTVRGLLARHPSVALLSFACVLANSDYALLEPTLGDYAISEGVIGTDLAAAEIGMLFLVASLAYTIFCPLAGILSSALRRPLLVISGGLLLQAIGLLVLAPTDGLADAVVERTPSVIQPSGTLARMRIALLMLGAGEALSMTPMLEAMASMCSDHSGGEQRWLETLGGLLSSAFALGQIIGPLMGASITSRLGFPTACALQAALLAACGLGVAGLNLMSRKARVRCGALPLPVTEEMQDAASNAPDCGDEDAPPPSSSTINEA